MKLIEIMKESEKQKQSKQKSFRLFEENAVMLDSLSESTGLSQNAILNSLLDDYKNEYLFINTLKASIDKILQDPKLMVVVYQQIYMGGSFSILTLLTLTNEDGYLTAKYTIYSSEGAAVNYFEDGTLILEDSFYFDTYDELVKNTKIDKDFKIEVFNFKDKLEYLITGISKK